MSTSDETGEVVPIQESNNDLNDRGQSEEGVFVFTAGSSGPSSPDYVMSKKEGHKCVIQSKDKILALLAQQLELRGSDSVS